MKKFTLLSFALVLATGVAFAAEPFAFQVKVTGHGQPMILIPGLASPGAVWDSTVAHFSDHYECHVLSLAGFAGTPPREDSGPVLESVRQELVAYIRQHNLAHPIIVGHSLGGFLALDLAAKNPELPGQLVIVDSLPFLVGIMKPGATADDAKQFATGASASFSQMNPEAYAQMIRGGPNGSIMASGSADLDRIIAWGLASDPATVSRAMRELYSADLRPSLSIIKCPALVLAAWIGYAPYSSHQFVEKTYGGQYAGLKGVRLAITDTARHFIMLDDPRWMFAQIEKFLATPNNNPVSSGQ